MTNSPLPAMSIQQLAIDITLGQIGLGWLHRELIFVLAESQNDRDVWTLLNVRDGIYNAPPIRLESLVLSADPLVKSCDWSVLRTRARGTKAEMTQAHGRH